MFLNIISKFLVWSREIEICRKHLKASIIDVIRIMPGIFFSDILIKDNISKNRLKVQKYIQAVKTMTSMLASNLHLLSHTQLQ